MHTRACVLSYCKPAREHHQVVLHVSRTVPVSEGRQCVFWAASWTCLCLHIGVLLGCRYWLGSCDLLLADSAALQASSQLSASTACRMLLAAPRLARVPTSFFLVLIHSFMLHLNGCTADAVHPLPCAPVAAAAEHKDDAVKKSFTACISVGLVCGEPSFDGPPL